MQAEEKSNLPTSKVTFKSTFDDPVALSERALALDPQNVRALAVLAGELVLRVVDGSSDDPAGDIARADKVADTALALQPYNSWVHHVKAMVYAVRRQWRPSVTEMKRRSR